MLLPKKDQFFVKTDEGYKSIRITRTINLSVSQADIRAILRWNFHANRTGFRARLMRSNPVCFKCGLPIGSASKNVHHIRALAMWADDVFNGALSLEDAKAQCNCLGNMRLMHKTCHESLEKTLRNVITF